MATRTDQNSPPNPLCFPGSDAAGAVRDRICAVFRTHVTGTDAALALLPDYLAELVLIDRALLNHLDWLDGGSYEWVHLGEDAVPREVLARVADAGFRGLAPEELLAFVFAPDVLNALNVLVAGRVRKELAPARVAAADPGSQTGDAVGADEAVDVWHREADAVAGRYLELGHAHLPSAAEIYRRATSPARPPVPIRRRHVHIEVVQHCFIERAKLEAEALEARLNRNAYPAAVAADLADRLEAINQKARRAADPLRFHRLDFEFHDAIGAGAGGVGEATRLLLDYPRPVTTKVRDRVCAEHAAYIDAIRRGDAEAATTASRTHLSRSCRRWLAEPNRRATRANIRFLRRFTGQGPNGDLLCVVSLNVSPVEMSARCSPRIVREVAAAVRRGTTVLYLRPSDSVIRRYRDRMGISGLDDLSEETLAEEFATFRQRLTASLGEAADPAAAAALVGDRVLQFHIPYRRLFDVVHPGGTLGYVRFGDGQERLNYRLPTWDDAAGTEIHPLSRTNALRNLFVGYIRKGFNHYIAACKKPRDRPLLLAAKSVLRRWFPPDGSAAGGGGPVPTTGPAEPVPCRRH